MSNLAYLPEAEPHPRAIETDNLADLTLIYEPDVNLCVARRRITPGISSFVSRLLLASQPIERELIFGSENPAVENLLPDDLQALPGAEAWLVDVEFLIGVFRDLFDSDHLGLRLRSLDKAMCPRFHVDRIPVRMICTYGGPGTQWLPEMAVNREKLGSGACGQPDETSGLILDSDSATIQSIPSFAIALLKGELWEGNEGRGAVHRSPQPTLQAPRRLLLTLDLL
jgi:Protein of unknown function (DUF1826)